MHIEPGVISQAKVMGANAAALGVLFFYAKRLLERPLEVVKAGTAAVFFSIFMQSFHMSVGPSELHFVGAMAVYLTLGFTPTLFGFAAGLLLQGLIFDPHDLVHLAVNSLSLIVPLITVHETVGKKLLSGESGKRLSWKAIVRLDAIYYAGVTSMVGFWLLIGDTATPFSAWAAFASSYLVVVACEPVITLATVRALKKYEHSALVKKLFVVKGLKLQS